MKGHRVTPHSIRLRQDTGASIQRAFLRVGLTDKDGWKPTGHRTEASNKWIKENAGIYRIQRVVLEEKQ
jgi:hypothetical protein